MHKDSPTLPYLPYEKLVWKKTLFSWIIKDIGADSQSVFDSSVCCSDINAIKILSDKHTALCGNDNWRQTSLQLSCHNSIMNPS